MRKPRISRMPDGEMHPYPHLKLTSEPFPRLLATRKIAGDGSEYFGAFLSTTAVRILIDFVNRTFRLRSCDIAIDGKFPVPCTQYYSRRCTAPCVSSLCSPADYGRKLDIVRLLLRNDREALRAEMLRRIGAASEALDFERAAALRDVLLDVEAFWGDPRRQVWLDDAVDTYRFEFGDDRLFVFLATQRGRRNLGSHVFEISAGEIDAGDVLRELLEKMYRRYAPREIRVPGDFAGRRELAKELGTNFGREIAIKVVSERLLGATVRRAVTGSRNELKLSLIGIAETTDELAARLRHEFRLAAPPERIEAYDAAHISATDFVAARIVRDLPAGTTAEFEYLLAASGSEPSALAELVAKRYSAEPVPPVDLVVVDGGRTQLNAAVGALKNFVGRSFAVISAVKPPGRHSQISHFLTEDGRRIEFDMSDAAHRLLLGVRDEVHELANAVHRLKRDMAAFYELAEVLPSLDEAARQRLLLRLGSIRRILEMPDAAIDEIFGDAVGPAIRRDIENFRSGLAIAVPPLIVPVRFDEFGGGAEDLRPIFASRGPKT